MLASSNYACSAYVVTNAFGSVIAADGSVLKGPAEPEKALATMITSQKPTLLTNTTLAFVVTNVKLDRSGLLRVLKVASAGFARAIRPVFTPVDGDVDVAAQVLYESLLGDMAAECVADAIRRCSGENL
ncbi:MAG: uncharacterized protein KVP18_003849 [Porospora cf. gigantea A]|uniref:uncharacterized protein n=1 Tax=Porospora cf. gigantea A TaxID=2853593 RepID=UPI00355A1E64|nr:MAG: hypothetical protein KVP18_003849 [Porospora cf. gigantea A]